MMEEAKEVNFFNQFLRSPNPEEGQVLHPDNPLLEKFQRALKEHLERQINHLKEDIYEYESGTKKNNAKRDQLGITVYEQQQVLDKQQQILDSCIAKLQTTTSAREEVENVVKERRQELRKQQGVLLEAESTELELRKEIEGTSLLIQQMEDWERSLESDITVKKRMHEKSRKDKRQLMEEKRMQDALIYRLMMRIWHLENEIDKMDVQIRVKEREREEMAQTVALGSTNIEAMESEYRCLMHSWNSVVIAIGNRDRVLTCLNTEMSKLTERFKSTVCEIEQVKKLCQKEMRRNEELTMLKDRFVRDLQRCRCALDAESAKKEALENRMREMHAIMEQTELDIQKIREEMYDVNGMITALTRERETVDHQKADLEEFIMRQVEEQVSNDKLAHNLKTVLKRLKCKNREMEIHLATQENKIANVLRDTEMQKLANMEMLRYMDELEEKAAKLTKEADSYQEEMKKLDLLVAKRQREVDYLNTKYLRMLDKSGIADSASPLEVKIATMEKNIEEVIEMNKQLQHLWLREQSNLLKISQERQEQIHNSNLMRKQMMILEQKNLKVTDELEQYRKQLDKVTRAINQLHSQLTVLGDNLVKTKGLKINMDKDNEVMRQDYIYKLKDAELECLQLEDEIEQLEEDKVNLSNDLIEINRQALEWEKKLISAKETKSTIIQEKGQEGEVGTMKAEIHRMNVRYSQLKKVQDVLINDLEHCVSRRDAMLTASEGREKRTKGGSDQTRINFNRKLDDVRNRIKQMENQVQQQFKKLEAYEQQKRDIENEIEEMQREIDVTKEYYDEMKEECEEAVTSRQMSFELLLLVQKKLNTYTDLSKGRKPYMVYRSENALGAAYSEEKSVNSKLCKIVENLQGDFPNRLHDWNRILNTLKLPLFVFH